MLTTSVDPNACVSGPGKAVIQANGQEYLVMINGSTFLALTLAAAEAIVSRTRQRQGKVAGGSERGAAHVSAGA